MSCNSSSKFATTSGSNWVLAQCWSISALILSLINVSSSSLITNVLRR